MIQNIFPYKRVRQAFFLLLIAATSCSTPLHRVIYMNGIEPGLTYTSGPEPEEYRIRPNDNLFIKVISDDPLNVAFLNLTDVRMTTSSYGNMELITFLVDENGFITYPYLGDIEVKGKTVHEVTDILQQKVDEYLQNASVFVKLVNRTVTVLGEVGRPGQLTMEKTRLTIFEALGMAGDITDYGNRQNVKIIRELPDGKHIEEIDLTNPQLVYSPFYYVLPHDIVYVEHSTRIFGAKNMSFTAPLSITASVISIGLLILNLFR